MDLVPRAAARNEKQQEKKTKKKNKKKKTRKKKTKNTLSSPSAGTTRQARRSRGPPGEPVGVYRSGIRVDNREATSQVFTPPYHSNLTSPTLAGGAGPRRRHNLADP